MLMPQKSSIYKLEAFFALVLFGLIFAWWISLQTIYAPASAEQLQLWAASYQIIALFGALVGIAISLRWGGLRSLIGRAISMFSLGLLFQVFGQSVYSYYIYFLNQPIPYPSIGDVGYFGSIPLYFYGALLIARAAGAHFPLRGYRNQLLSVILPLLMLSLSYTIFLSGYSFDWSTPVKMLLDFGYPLGQAMYVSAAILAFLLSRNLLGGLMRLPMLAFIGALIIQYIADFMFLYQANAGLWFAGGTNDMIYAVSYLVMTLSLIYIGYIYLKIHES